MPELVLHNTLTRGKDVFKPIDENNVRMYVCGPTVYDRAHIGNARPIIVFDMLFRLLRHVYGEAQVKYVRNITDVDDKINARAAERGVSIAVLTQETTAVFHADVAALGCLPPTHEPRATQYIAEMKTLIEKLIARGYAYVAKDHVLFDVEKMAQYGALANRSLDDMLAGARVEVAPYKKNAMDFVLWKPSKPGEPSWPSPAGIVSEGRPGWHIECSAMSGALLGEEFDIHGGGIDLVFPHHENEIAQSCCAHGRDKMAQVWMHNGFLQIEGQKMSKSLGNFTTIGEVLAGWPGDTVRLAMLMTHYRQPINWTQAKLAEAHTKLARWAQAVRSAHKDKASTPTKVIEALCHDLNTWDAVVEIDRLAHAAQTDINAANELLGALEFFGFRDAAEKVGLLHQGESVRESIDKAILQLIEERNTARATKNWAESDRLRDLLKEKGITLQDNKDGTSSIIS